MSVYVYVCRGVREGECECVCHCAVQQLGLRGQQW